MKLTGHRFILAAAFASVFALVPAFAQQPSSSDIANTLAPPKKATTRGLGAAQPKAADPAKAAREQALINEVRGKSRSISVEQRAELAKLAETKPAVDLEVNFEYNSATIGPKAIDDLTKLGLALRDERLKDAVIMLAGHTDAKGGDDYNKELSERRAEAVKQLLVSKFGVPATNLVAVGYGREKLKNSSNPLAPENRRVQVVNMSAQ